MVGELISFPATRFDKVFARAWLGFIGTVFLFGVFSGEFDFVGLMACFVLLAFGAHYFHKTVWSLAEEVWDCGDHLKIRKSGKQQVVFFQDISSINSTYSNHKCFITVKTKMKGSFGKNITFRAVNGEPWIRSPKVLAHLQQRVKNA